jgi:hypothetical protein
MVFAGERGPEQAAQGAKKGRLSPRAAGAPGQETRIMIELTRGGAPAAEKSRQILKMTAGRAALLGLMRCYLMPAMDPTVTLLEIHKLMYFMQEAGEPLRLRFEKGPYGPYAENLRQVLSHIEGHFIEGYGDAEDQPEKPLRVKPGSWEQAERFLADHRETYARFHRVEAVIEGFETPFGMELLSNVHWVVSREAAATADEATSKVHAWSDRKLMFTSGQIHSAWTALDERGWIA